MLSLACEFNLTQKRRYPQVQAEACRSMPQHAAAQENFPRDRTSLFTAARLKPTLSCLHRDQYRLRRARHPSQRVVSVRDPSTLRECYGRLPRIPCTGVLCSLPQPAEPRYSLGTGSVSSCLHPQVVGTPPHSKGAFRTPQGPLPVMYYNDRRRRGRTSLETPPPLDPPPPLPMFEADSQNLASAPLAPTAFKLNNFSPRSAETIGGPEEEGGPSQPPPPPPLLTLP